jgi:hypothetical protein
MNLQDAQEIANKIPEGRYSTLIDSLNSICKDADRFEYGLPTFGRYESKLLTEIKEWFVEIILDYPELFGERNE